MKIITHSGGFHADDVFGVAALLLAFGDGAEIVRTREEKIISAGETAGDIILDVGGKYDGEKFFDHHQIGGAGERANGLPAGEAGVPFASFGLIWKKFGQKICADSGAGANAQEVAGYVDKNFIQAIDAGDNGVGELKPFFKDVYPNALSIIIENFSVLWTEDPKSQDQKFADAVSIAKKILARQIEVAKAEIAGAKAVEEIYKNSADKRIIILDKNYPWLSVLCKYPEPIFVVEPAGGDRNGWKAVAVRDNPASFKNRKDFPAGWAGKRGIDLAQISGVPDAVFCHRQLFIAVAKSREGALALAQKALGV